MAAALLAATPALAQEARIDTGDTAWMLTSTALVLMMTIPGLALFYAGMVRKKNVLATMMQSFALAALVSVVWMVAGYSLAFGEGNAYVGDLSRLFLGGLAEGWDKPFTLGSGPAAVATTIPETVFLMFQMTFAIITPALITGAFADRMRFSAMVVFSVLWSLLVYAPVAHWVWHPNGWIFGLGALDFAGGTVVHINAGVAGLVCAIVLGKRVGYGNDNMSPFNLALAVIGASLLWVGWFGFNAGSAAGAGARAGMAMLVTQLAAATAALSWMFAEWATKGKPSVLGAISGAVAGLVAITPASGFVLPVPALVIGLVAGLAGFWGATALKHLCGYDDSLDAFGVHGVCGIVGSLLVGVFAYGPLSATAAAPEGSSGSLDQFLLQLCATAAVFAFSAIGTFLLLKVTDALVGLRVAEEEEREGLDVTQHGERIA
ncbi:ammonium transporter [Siccirubricoccus sp. G192]|uniref:ammonium transporter n=1 Tax=Siccirubricoccus sp. G192 TaxID=2849651 RepID=UPI001C2CB437|nr:ammonium transporter [Siccirubricoccus sp. G192]MBV1800122.1 ammonium transporter [Siccirubricoccus sp. G192]